MNNKIDCIDISKKILKELFTLKPYQILLVKTLNFACFAYIGEGFGGKFILDLSIYSFFLVVPHNNHPWIKKNPFFPSHTYPYPTPWLLINE